MNAGSPNDLIHGLRPTRLVEVAQQIVPDDFSLEVLLLVGSLAEGLGSATSDIDLIMLVGGSGELPLDEVALVVDGVLVDVQLRPLAQCACRLAAAADWGSGGEQALTTTPFGEAERTLLHRLLNGEYLYGTPDRLAPDAVREAALRTLLRLKFDSGRHDARARQVDAHGCFVDGDFVLAAVMAHDAFHYAVDALTAALGESNINPKWRLRLLRRLARQGLISDAISEMITRLMMSGVDPADDEACAAFAARATAGVRALLVGATNVFDLSLPLGLSVRSAGSSTASVGQRLRLDLDFGVAPSSTQLRLLSGDRPLHELTLGEIEAVFSLDPDAQLVVQSGGGYEGAADPSPGLVQWLASNAATSTTRDSE